MRIHPDVLAAHAQFGGDLKTMQRCYELYDLKSEIESLRSRSDKAEAELLTMIASRDGYARQSAARAQECDRIREDLLHYEGLTQRLQKALAFWMPGVSEKIEVELDGRAGDDAGLLAGFKGKAPLLSWGDLTIDRAEKAEAERDAAVGKHKVWMEKVKQMLHASWRRRETAEATCEKLAKALDQAQKALASMIDPSSIAQTAVIYAFATATTAEATSRHVLSEYRKEASE